MNIKPKVGQRVRINNEYPVHAWNERYSPGVEFVVSQVVMAKRTLGERSDFYVKGVDYPRGVWGKFLDLVEEPVVAEPVVAEREDVLRVAKAAMNTSAAIVALGKLVDELLGDALSSEEHAALIDRIDDIVEAVISEREARS